MAAIACAPGLYLGWIVVDHHAVVFSFWVSGPVTDNICLGRLKGAEAGGYGLKRASSSEHDNCFRRLAITN